MKSLGNKSSSRISSVVSGLMKIFAYGVAVIPRYDACRNNFNRRRIASLIAVGFSSSFFVLTEALSASSSIKSMGRLIAPRASRLLLFSHLMRLLRMLLFFLITKRTVVFTLCNDKFKTRRIFLSKSFMTDVNVAICFSCPYLPTPTGTFSISCLGSRRYLLILPENSASRRSCVC